MFNYHFSSFQPWWRLLGFLTILGIQNRTNQFHASLFLHAFPVDENEDNGYTSWKQNEGSNYDQYTYLKRDGVDVDAALHWSIFEEEESIKMALITKASGWSAFGIAESGGMPGSDIAVFTMSEDGIGVLMDYHATAYAPPELDDSHDDWTLVSSSLTQDGFLIWEAERLLDTGDVYGDRVILNDAMDPSFPATKIIVAWGDSSSMSYHGSNKVKGEVRFFANDDTGGMSAEEKLIQQLEDESDGSFVIGAVEHDVSTSETTYEHFCFSKDDLISYGLPEDDDVHIIGFQPIIDKTPYVHHMLIRTSNSDSNLPCDTSFISNLLFVWAFGGDSSLLPSEAGFKLGPTGIKNLLVETHYDNVNNVDGIVDSSAFRVYWTKTLRQHDAGTLEIADPQVSLGGSKLGNGVSHHSFFCPSTCTSNTFQQDVTVFAEMLHMHEKGVMMTNEHIRGNDVVRKSVVEYYDFQQTGGFFVPQNKFTVKVGDSFRTECFYSTTSNNIKFGVASSDEMCIAYLFYYPLQPTPYGICGYDWYFNDCSTEYTDSMLNGLSDLSRVFGTENIDTSGAPSMSPVHSVSTVPTKTPTLYPSSRPSSSPLHTPSAAPISFPTSLPSPNSSDHPSQSPLPTFYPSLTPSVMTSTVPTYKISESPTNAPTTQATLKSSSYPSFTPSVMTSSTPSKILTDIPSETPHMEASNAPSFIQTMHPSRQPSKRISDSPSSHFSKIPSLSPQQFSSNEPFPMTSSGKPSLAPSIVSASPSDSSSLTPTNKIQSLEPTSTGNVTVNATVTMDIIYTKNQEELTSDKVSTLEEELKLFLEDTFLFVIPKIFITYVTIVDYNILDSNSSRRLQSSSPIHRVIFKVAGDHTPPPITDFHQRISNIIDAQGDVLVLNLKAVDTSFFYIDFVDALPPPKSEDDGSSDSFQQSSDDGIDTNTVIIVVLVVGGVLLMALVAFLFRRDQSEQPLEARSRTSRSTKHQKSQKMQPKAYKTPNRTHENVNISAKHNLVEVVDTQFPKKKNDNKQGSQDVEERLAEC